MGICYYCGYPLQVMIISRISKMGKNVLVISSSLRVTSNSAVLAHEIVRGASDAAEPAGGAWYVEAGLAAGAS